MSIFVQKLDGVRTEDARTIHDASMRLRTQTHVEHDVRERIQSRGQQMRRQIRTRGFFARLFEVHGRILRSNLPLDEAVAERRRDSRRRRPVRLGRAGILTTRHPARTGRIHRNHVVLIVRDPLHARHTPGAVAAIATSLAVGAPSPLSPLPLRRAVSRRQLTVRAHVRVVRRSERIQRERDALRVRQLTVRVLARRAARRARERG